MLSVFAADSSDIDWMVDLYLDGAHSRHFLIDINNTNFINVCRRNIASIIFRKCIIDFELQAYAMVFEDNGVKIGYAVVSEIQSSTGGNELHLFIVDKNYRNKGYGKLMLAEVIKRIQPIADLYIRCFPASKQMISLAKKNGFQYSHTNAENAEVYILKKYAQKRPQERPISKKVNTFTSCRASSE